MPLKKLVFKPGVNKENTRYTTEGGWYDCDKIRFRQGTPEKIGGWQRISSNTFLGVCRSLWNWVTLGGLNLVSVGTNLKYYIERGGQYYDVTPIRATTSAGDVTFAATTGSATITVTDTGHGANQGDFVTFSGAVSLGGNITADVLNQEYQIQSIIDANSYTITATATANASDVGDGGASVVGAYQIHVGAAIQVPIEGWGGGAWGSGTWGFGGISAEPLRLWSQSNFGEDLVMTYRGGELYYWDSSSGTSNNRAVAVTGMMGASDVPTILNIAFVSDVYRFTMAFGCNELGDSALDPMLIRWSDQESVVDWTPSATNQAGGIRLSHGSEIVSVIQTRQEIVVFTDSSVYSLQYLGAGSGVWGAQILGDNISIASQNACSLASGVVYWMGVDKFYMYDGRVQTLKCDLRKYVFQDINTEQFGQVISGTNEGFNEVWWFYPSKDSTTNDRYVVYNYREQVWYYGTMARTAWLDSGLRDYPLAATYSQNLVNHEVGVDDNESGTPVAIEAYVSSSEFDIDDGHNFGFVWRMLPDITFNGSTVDSPNALFTLIPLKNSGSGYTDPQSVGGESYATVTRTATIPVEAFTGQVYTRVRGRQMVLKVESDGLGTAWQLGAPRIDIRPDGRR